MRYNDGSESSKARASGALKYTHYMGDAKAYAEVRTTGDIRQIGAGYEGGIEGSDTTWRIGVQQIDSSNLPSDRRIGIELNFPLEKQKAPAFSRPSR